MVYNTPGLHPDVEVNPRRPGKQLVFAFSSGTQIRDGLYGLYPISTKGAKPLQVS
jgi:hypothetical protein